MTEPRGPIETDSIMLSFSESRGESGSWRLDLATGQMSWSAGLYRLLGLEAGGTPPTMASFLDALHPADRRDLPHAGRLFAVGGTEPRRFRIVRPDGDVRWVRAASRTVGEQSGSPTHLLGVVFDVTEQRPYLDAYQQQEGLLEALRELFEVTIWRTAADGSVIDGIEWWQTTGLPAHQSLGWARLETIHPDDRQRVRDAWTAALADGRHYRSEFRALLDGAFVPMISRGLSLRDASGRVSGWIGVAARLERTPSPPGRMAGTTTCEPTPELIRAARGYLGWTATELADHSGVSFSTVRRLEMPGYRSVRSENLAAIQRSFEAHGVRFVDTADGGVGILARRPT